MIYDDKTKTLVANLENEWIYDNTNTGTPIFFKHILLGKNDVGTHYQSMIIENMEEYMAQLIDNE